MPSRYVGKMIRIRHALICGLCALGFVGVSLALSSCKGQGDSELQRQVRAAEIERNAIKEEIEPVALGRSRR